METSLTPASTSERYEVAALSGRLRFVAEQIEPIEHAPTLQAEKGLSMFIQPNLHPLYFVLRMLVASEAPNTKGLY